MIKKFREFVDEGFMSRMVDTVYNDKPKKENTTEDDRLFAKILMEWIDLYQVLNTAGIEKTNQDEIGLQDSTKIYFDPESEFPDGLELILSKNRVRCVIEYSDYSTNRYFRFTPNNPKITIEQMDGGETNIYICKSIWDILPEEYKKKV